MNPFFPPHLFFASRTQASIRTYFEEKCGSKQDQAQAAIGLPCSWLAEFRGTIIERAKNEYKQLFFHPLFSSCPVMALA